MKGKVIVPILLGVVLLLGGTVSFIARKMVEDRKARGVEVPLKPVEP